jgi:outer membrane biosynthesis protein TonB
MRRFLEILALLAAVLSIVSGASVACAQRVRSSGERKILSRASVVYPKIALQMRLQGIVKITATVAPNGKVVKTELIGGSPVFVPYALDAVALMKWESAGTETKEVLEIEFVPSNPQ